MDQGRRTTIAALCSLGLGYQGGAQAVEMSGPIRSTVLQPKGAGAPPRSFRNMLCDTVSIMNFGAKWDGVTDDTAALNAAWHYATSNGVIVSLPAGTCNAGTFRASFQGTSKGFGFVGAGAGVTVLKFADIPPIASTHSEPNLFTLAGTSTAPIYNAHFEGFTLDYSAQTNKGGATLDTLAQTDIKPYSRGVDAIHFSHCVGLLIHDVNVNSVYGDGFIGNQSPFTLIEHCRLSNVSGGNPGGPDSFGGAIALMLGSFGSRVSNCVAFNTRQYQTATIAGYCTITSQNTPCGYIGFWSEFPMNQDNSAAALPPYASHWLSGVVGKDAARHGNDENMSVVFENCFAYGYTIGFKCEGGVATYFKECVALNCWMPFIAAAARGRATGCYADCLNLDGMKCPMSGYQYVRALYVHYNVTNAQHRYAGFTFDGCISHTRNTDVFTDNCGYGKFLNQQTWIDYPGTGGVPQMFATRSTGVVEGVEIRGGHIQIEGLTASFVSQTYDAPSLLFDVGVVNTSAFPYNFLFGHYSKTSSGTAVKIRGSGLIGITMGAGCINSTLDAVLRHDNTTVSFPRNYDVVALHDSGISAKVAYDTHTSIVSGSGGNGALVFATKSNEVDLEVNLKNSGTNTLANGLLVLGGPSVNVKRIIKTGDTYNNPLVWPIAAAQGWHIEEASSNDAGPIVNNQYALIGPITLGPRLLGQKLWKHPLASDPNNINNLSSADSFPEGLSVPYLKPSLSSARGWQVFTAGRSAPAWIANHAYRVNTYVRANKQVYRCATAGTSSTRAPSVTSGTQTDGGVTWTWEGPFAQFVEYDKYAGAALT